MCYNSILSAYKLDNFISFIDSNDWSQSSKANNSEGFSKLESAWKHFLFYEWLFSADFYSSCFCLYCSINIYPCMYLNNYTSFKEGGAFLFNELASNSVKYFLCFLSDIILSLAFLFYRISYYNLTSCCYLKYCSTWS